MQGLGNDDNYFEGTNQWIIINILKAKTDSVHNTLWMYNELCTSFSRLRHSCLPFPHVDTLKRSEMDFKYFTFKLEADEDGKKQKLSPISFSMT